MVSPNHILYSYLKNPGFNQGPHIEYMKSQRILWEELGGKKGDRFEKGDWSQKREPLGAKLALWGTRKLKVVDSDAIKAVF